MSATAHRMSTCIAGTVPLLLNEGSFSKASAPPLFLEDENIFSRIGLHALHGFQFYLQDTYYV
jgi:hypothetical protein